MLPFMFEGRKIASLLCLKEKKVLFIRQELYRDQGLQTAHLTLHVPYVQNSVWQFDKLLKSQYCFIRLFQRKGRF